MSKTRTIVTFAGLALGAGAFGAEIIVPTQMPLSVALATAASGDTITLLPSGSPYQQYPGFSFANKRLLIRGSTGNAGDVVLDGVALDIVLRIDGAGAADSVLEHLTIRNGRGSSAANSNGAGLVLTNGAGTTLRHCVIRDNVNPGADGNGAGIYAANCTIRLEDCLIENNTTLSNTGDGGGVFVYQGFATSIRTTFRNNGIPSSVTLVGGSIGGAYYAEIGTNVLVQCRFEGNRSWDGAGLAMGNGGIAQADACEFVNNTGRFGAGFYTTSNGGGGTLRNSVFRGNSVTADYSAACLLRSVLFSNCTFASNTAAGNYVFGGAAGITLDNSIVWGNTLGSAGLVPANQVLARQNILQATISGASGSRNNLITDPKFKSATDLHLTSNSPAIDAGDTSLYAGPFTDFSGAYRCVDTPTVADTGSSIMGPVIDIGAYEFIPVMCTADVDDGSGTGTPDGGVTIDDLLYYLLRFHEGC